MPPQARKTHEHTGKQSVSPAQSLIDEVEERLAAQKLREVVATDREEFGPVSAEALEQAEQEW
ncbi:hypothetical protein AB0O31_12520 [Kitasatospora cineracea]|uniref:hypothetical protein n=1 Tax=Kitasatospora cineracea TaxID=88074 RepID=UPI003425405B